MWRAKLRGKIEGQNWGAKLRSKIEGRKLREKNWLYVPSIISWRGVWLGIDTILHVVKNKFPMSHSWSHEWQMGNFTNLQIFNLESQMNLLYSMYCNTSYSESDFFFHKRREMHKDMILLQKKYSPMHNAQCGCKGYLPLRPKRFLSCWILNGKNFYEVTA